MARGCPAAIEMIRPFEATRIRERYAARFDAHSNHFDLMAPRTAHGYLVERSQTSYNVVAQASGSAQTCWRISWLALMGGRASTCCSRALSRTSKCRHNITWQHFSLTTMHGDAFARLWLRRFLDVIL